MSPLRQLLRSAMTAVLPRSRFLVSGPATSFQVALTFDDGPHHEHTPRLLDRLAELGLPATFFVVGRCAVQHPELVRRIVAEGHALGHHSWTHSEPADTSAAVLGEEVDRSIALLRSLTGRTIDRFRPPKGQLTAAKFYNLWRRGQRVILWNSDPRDYRMQDAAELTEWAAAHVPAPGEVVLLHDIHPHATAALDAFAAWRRHGANFVTLDAWLPA